MFLFSQNQSKKTSSEIENRIKTRIKTRIKRREGIEGKAKDEGFEAIHASIDDEKQMYSFGT